MRVAVLLLPVLATVVQSHVVAASQATCDASKENFGCSVFGRCRKDDRNCYCNTGFTGDGKVCTSSCAAKASEICDNSTSVACVDFGDAKDNYRCACRAGYLYSTATKHCEDLNECDRQWCSRYSQCVNEVGDYQCKCCYKDEGTTGYSAFGYVGDGKKHCYAETIIHYGDTEDTQFRDTPGFLHLNLRGGFPYFGELRWDIYIHTDGVISFDNERIPFYGSNTEYPTNRNTEFLAPFWTKLKPSKRAGAGLYVDHYKLLTLTPKQMFTALPHFYGVLDELGLSGYQPRQFILATWKDMEAADFPGSGRITFQTIFVTNGSHSFSFTSYSENPEHTDWKAPLDNVYIGFPLRRPVKDISELYDNPHDKENVCEKMTFLTLRGRWFQNFGNLHELENSNADCIDEAVIQNGKYGYFGNDDEEDEKNGLPQSLYCPCNEAQAYTDNRFVRKMVPGVKRACHMSRFFKTVTQESKNYTARAYCCYDEKGILATKGLQAGGVVPDGQEEEMLRLKNACCKSASFCEAFHRIYRPVTCHRYDKPRTATISGPGHFNLFSHSDYTFNGRGEYLYLTANTSEIFVQIRMVNQTYKNRATSFVKAVAIKCEFPGEPRDLSKQVTNIAEIRANEAHNIVELLINHVKQPIPHLPVEAKEKFFASCDKTSCEVSCKFSSNVYSFKIALVNSYLEIRSTIPATREVVDLSTSGLVGTPDGKLEYRDNTGKVITIEDLNNETEIYKFGEAWRTAEAASLFTYDTAHGESWKTVNEEANDYKPALWSEVKKQIQSDNVHLLSHCGADKNCQYDQLVTEDKAISKATNHETETIRIRRNVLATLTPQWKKSPRVMLSIHKDFETNLTDYIQADEYGNPITPDFYQIETNINPNYYQLDEKTGYFKIFSSKDVNPWLYGHYYATIYAGKLTPYATSSRYELELFVCACSKDEQCDYSFANRTYLEMPANVYNYYVLPCRCPPQLNHKFCLTERVPCASNPCSQNAVCEDNPEDASGYTCTCKAGYIGNGLICKLDECPADHGCSHACNVDPVTLKPVCSCNGGYTLNADGKTCEDIDECTFPVSCEFEHEICRNTPGSFYCECEAGYKPKKGSLRGGCLETPYTYAGVIEFEQYWSILQKKWLGWDAELDDPSSPNYNEISRHLEPVVEIMLNMMLEPKGEDFFTYVSKVKKGDQSRIVLHYQFYPNKTLDAVLLQKALRDYFTTRPDGSILKGVVASSISVVQLPAKDVCPKKNACGTPFATCRTSNEDGAICHCNPGFLPQPILVDVPVENVTSCASYCYVRNCEKETTYSCRDNINQGPQCLCKKGYKVDPATFQCKPVSFCKDYGINPCGPGADCIDSLGSYECKCKSGFAPSNKPPPAPHCLAKVIYCCGEQDGDPQWPDGVEVNEETDYTKIAIPVGFPFADSEQWKVFVSPNGMISFGKRPTATERDSFFPSEFGYFVAPMWSDFDGKSVSIRIYDATLAPLTASWLEVIEQIRSDMRAAEKYYPYYNALHFSELPDVETFAPKTIILVTWRDARLKPNTAEDHATFQAIIASDGDATVVVANYDLIESSLIENWSNYPHRGFVGFQMGERRLCLQKDGFSESSKDCRSFDFKQLTSQLSPSLAAGRHVFLVAHERAATTSPDRRCFETLKRWAVDHVDEKVELNYVHSALSEAQPPPDPCPWTETQVKLDERFISVLGTKIRRCFVKRFFSDFTYKSHDNEIKTAKIRPYCCYRNGALLSQTMSDTHIEVEEFEPMLDQLYKRCCIDSAHCPIVSYMSPPYYASHGYVPPVTAAVFGDPHIITIDGISITFKGRGDYVLYNHPNLKLHGRFDKLAKVDNGSALTALAWEAEGRVVNVSIASDNGDIDVAVDGKLISLKDYLIPDSFDMHGHIRAKRNDAGFSMTYVDGLHFDVVIMKDFPSGPYLQLRLRLPRDIYANTDSTPTGLLGDFILPNGQPYQPIFYGTHFTGDQDCFMKYGRNWAVSKANATPMFSTIYESDYEPFFYESFLIHKPEVHPLFDHCQGSLPCTYDLAVTGDELLANATFNTAVALKQIRQEATERPPEFVRNGDTLIWIIILSNPYSEYVPELVDPSPDIVFSIDTNFPRQLFLFDPANGQFVIRMTDEAKDTLLHKGPFYFNIFARRGASGFASFVPIAIRICNCLDERSCDFSDELDGIGVGVIPTKNAQHYSIARCNCYPFQTGIFCDKAYNPCEAASPCYPGVACIRLTYSDINVPSFKCFGCPQGMDGDGIHCKPKDPCEGVICSAPKTCQATDGVGVCTCPPGTKPTEDGQCQQVGRCNDPDKPKVCNGVGMKCNDASGGRHWCSCHSGHSPMYSSSIPPTLQACIPISYTYHGQLSFNWYYHPSQDLVRYSLEYSDVPTDTYKTFARDVTIDVRNAINILKYNSIIGGSIERVSPFSADKGFTIDYFVHSDMELDPEEIQKGLALYFDQTRNVGSLVQIANPRYTTFFVDICKSKTFNPCQDIMDIGTCQQTGVKGFGSFCECNETLGYFTIPMTTPEGQLTCQDMCDATCKGSDRNSKCIRPDGRAQSYKCVCSEGFIFNATTSLCQERPSICKPTSCQLNADCVPINEGTSFKCVCRPGFNESKPGVCTTYCEVASHCAGVANAFGCTNLDDGYKCNCNAHYLWDETSLSCKEINECDLGAIKCPAHSKCSKVSVGVYTCNCDDEYSNYGGTVCYGETLYPYDFSDKKAFIQDSEGVWNTTFLSGFYYIENILFKINVGFDGFISFDYLPPYKYFGKKLSTHLIAPFFMDLDVLPNNPHSGLHIDVFDHISMTPNDKWKTIFAKSFQNLRLHKSWMDIPEGIIPEMVVIATWQDVTIAPASSYGQYKTTFQAVLTMASSFSFVIYNYMEAPSVTNWPLSEKMPALQPQLGYTIGNPADGVSFLPLIETSSFHDVFKYDEQIRGRHVAAFGRNEELLNRQCTRAYRNFPASVFDILGEINKDPKMRRIACPGFLQQIHVDPRWRREIDLANSGAVCFGGNFWTPVSLPPASYNVRSMCCYDQASGAFLDNKPPARHVGSFIQVKEFRSLQEAFFEPCCEHSPYCPAFGMKHPASILIPDENYDAPSIGYIIGDPHLGVVAHPEDHPGREVTFNGRGEYTLVKSKEFTTESISAINIQARFSFTKATSRATFITGVAVQVGTADKVEVFTQGGELHVFRKGVKQDIRSLLRSDQVLDDGSFDLWAEGDFLRYVASSGVSLAIYHVDKSYLEIRFTLPSHLANHEDARSCGLLTSFDESPYQDCDGKDAGTDIWGNELDAFNFGQRFKLASQDQSLFSYLEGPSFSEINNVPSGWKPVFRSDLDGQYPTDVDAICDTSTSCRYDYAVTFDKVIGRQSRVSSDKFQRDQRYNLAKRPPVLQGRESSLSIRTPESPSLFVIKSFRELPGLTYSLDTNVAPAFYTFNENNGEMKLKISDELLRDMQSSVHAPYFRISALQTPTADIWTPAIFTCACDQISQCDFDYKSLFYTERLSNLKHNHFLPCNCPPTRRGTYCEIKFNPCDEHPCSANAQCLLSETAPAGFTCGSCPPDHIPVDGICKPKVCPENYCTNGDCAVGLDGSYICICNLGYEQSPNDKKVCQDIDECKVGSHNCYHLGPGMQCNNNPGSYVCTCKSGYSPDNSSNILTCIREENEIDGIVKSNSVIVELLQITWTQELAVIGSPLFVSVANQIENDLLTWYKKDLGMDNIKSIYVKKLSEGSIKADYAAYFSSPVNVASLEDKQKDYFKTRSSIGNMQGVDPATVKVSVDLCKHDKTCDPTSTKCVWDPAAGKPICECLSGFAPNPGSPTSCIENCQKTCEDEHGDFVRCSRNATSPSEFECNCLPHYSQAADTKKCVDKCHTKPCQNGGTCSIESSTGDYACKCTPNYYGHSCENKCDCQNGGKCDEKGKCWCTEEYSGDKCESEQCQKLCEDKHGAFVKCSRNATSSEFECNCLPHYSQTADTKKCVDKCHTKPCQNGGTCSIESSTGNYACKCTPNYYGHSCETLCHCRNNGVCAISTAGYVVCECRSGFYGRECENKCDCQNGGTCSVTPDGIRVVCKCADDYYGEKCSNKCGCKNGGKCDERGKCWCTDKYNGDKCETEVKERVKVVNESDSTKVIIVSSVLGAATFILLCLSIYAFCTRKGGESAARNQGGDVEISTRQPLSASPAPAAPATSFLFSSGGATNATPVYSNVALPRVTLTAETTAKPQEPAAPQPSGSNQEDALKATQQSAFPQPNSSEMNQYILTKAHEEDEDEF